MSSHCEIHFRIAWHPEWDEHENHQGKVSLLLLFLDYSGVMLVKVCCIRNVKNSCAACSRPPIIDESTPIYMYTFSLNNGFIIGQAGASPPIRPNGMIFLHTIYL